MNTKHISGLVDKIKTLVRRFSAMSLIFKIIPLLTLLVLTPSVGLKADSKNDVVTSIELGKDGVPFVIAKESTLQIVVGDSSYDAKRKAIAQTSAPADNKRLVIAREGRGEKLTLDELREIYRAASAKYGVPWQLIEAVHQVESGKSCSTARKSSAGATGPMQFMLGTWRSYGQDGNGDGVTDITNVYDAVYGGANYLAANGANRGDLSGALYHYNHSTSYVNKVLAIAREIGL